MPNNDYHFVTTWNIHGSIEEIVPIVADARDLTRWWPSVYLDVQELDPGDERGLGKVVSLYTKGWLPYTLHWQFRVSEIGPQTLRIEATGDFVGRGIWSFAQEGEWTRITYDWKIRADKPLLRWFSFVMKPIFAANHHWAMVKGEESLKLELARRRAQTPAELARIAPPPPPTTTSSLPLLLGLAGMLAAGYALVRATRR